MDYLKTVIICLSTIPYSGYISSGQSFVSGERLDFVPFFRITILYGTGVVYYNKPHPFRIKNVRPI